MMRSILALAFVIICVSLTSCGGGSGGSSSGTMGTPDGGVPPPPPTTCTLPEMLANVTKPMAIVGDGSPASCTEAALAAAIAGGGTITFDCGAAPMTITMTAELPVTVDTVIDGGNLVTLSGGQTTRIMHIKSAWNLATPKLVVQNLTFTEGFTSDVPDTSSTSEGGAAIFEDGGSLTVIGCTFTHNQSASTGQDVSGGAINGQGVGTLIVENSVFSDNAGSNGGAVGTQDENVTIVNTTFSNNTATGNGGNPGNGGDGGALSYDGAHVSLTFCGDQFLGNHANAQGGAIFRVAYNDELTEVDRSTFAGNSADPMVGLAGAVYLEYTDIEMTGTTISGNSAHYGGGIWIGHAAIAHLTNVSIVTAVLGDNLDEIEDEHVELGDTAERPVDIFSELVGVWIEEREGVVDHCLAVSVALLEKAASLFEQKRTFQEEAVHAAHMLLVALPFALVGHEEDAPPDPDDRVVVPSTEGVHSDVEPNKVEPVLLSPLDITGRLGFAATGSSFDHGRRTPHARCGDFARASRSFSE